MKTIIYTIISALCCLGLYSCDKVSATGLLIGATGTDDRVKMSIFQFENGYMDAIDFHLEDDEKQDYSVMIGSDSHIWNDTCRFDEMFEKACWYGDLFIAHCGDLADTQPEPYGLTAEVIANWNERWYNDPLSNARKSPFFGEDSLDVPFFPVVGNHDITHNGYTLFTKVFPTSSYVVNVYLKGGVRDVHLFIDSAAGTLGTLQKDWFEKQMAEDVGGLEGIRNVYVYTHTNLFRGTSGNVQFASTYPREETYMLLKWFHDINESTKMHNSKVICGHIHEYDEYEYGGVKYYNCESMSERNNPDAGPWLLRLNCSDDGTSSVDRVEMTYSPTTKKYNAN